MKRYIEIIIALLALTTVSTAFTATRQADAVVIYKTKEVAMKSVDVKSIARELLTKKSYGCLTRLIYAESRFNADSLNASSHAKGIGQLLPETYRNLGMKHSEDPKVQLIAMLAYIARHYGGTNGTCAALRHELKYHNY